MLEPWVLPVRCLGCAGTGVGCSCCGRDSLQLQGNSLLSALPPVLLFIPHRPCPSENAVRGCACPSTGNFVAVALQGHC